MVRCKGKAYNQLSGGWINCSYAAAMACTISGEIFAQCAVNLCRLYFYLRQSMQKMPLNSYFLIRNLKVFQCTQSMNALTKLVQW